MQKAQRTRRLSSYHKITVHSSKILNILQFQKTNKALKLKSQPDISISTKSKVKILTKPTFRILTKNQLRDLNQTSAAKKWLNFKISPELKTLSTLVKILKLKFRRDFEAEILSVFCCWCFVEITKLNLGNYILKLGLVKILTLDLVEMLVFGWDFEVNA